jgi:hypothetical protein
LFSKLLFISTQTALDDQTLDEFYFDNLPAMQKAA